jgi:isopenicillin N synthase-like dioxygenase
MLLVGLLDPLTRLTLNRIERPRNHKDIIDKLTEENKPVSATTPVFDAKWRFFWRIGPQPPSTRFPSLNPQPVIPAEFPEWKDIMDMWGNKMLNALCSVAEMAAQGFGMPSDAFTSRMLNGPHLLAPTASDFNKYAKIGTVLAGFHSDLNFMTIHGKSRYPGLSVWTRDGKRVGVAVPDGCLLVQAGKQFEYLTGGYVHAGYHEVVVNDNTLNTIAKRKAAGKSLWRISSTLFGHIQSDQLLTPLAPFDNDDAKLAFPEIYTGEFVRRELQAIALDRS